MEDKELLTLAGRLNLPEAVLAPLAAAAKALPEGLPIKQLTEPEAAAADWKTMVYVAWPRSSSTGGDAGRSLPDGGAIPQGGHPGGGIFVHHGLLPTLSGGDPRPHRAVGL